MVAPLVIGGIAIGGEIAAAIGTYFTVTTAVDLADAAVEIGDAAGAAGQGRDRASELEDMQKEAAAGERMVNPVSAGIDWVCDGLDHTIFAPNPVSDVLGGAFRAAGDAIGGGTSAVLGGITGLFGNEDLGKGLGEGIGDFVADPLRTLTEGSLESLQGLSNTVGAWMGAAPVTKNSEMREDEGARERVMEKLRAMEADGFVEEGVADGLSKQLDEYAGVIPGGWEGVEEMFSEGDPSLDSIYKDGSWKEMTGGAPALDKADLRLMDSSEYADMLTDEQASAIWDACEQTGLISHDAKNDEEALFGSAEVADLEVKMASGEMDMKEAGAYLATYLDAYGVTSNPEFTAVLEETGFYDGMEGSEAAQTGQSKTTDQSEATAASQVSDAECQSYIKMCEDAGVVGEGTLERAQEMVANGEASWNELATELAIEVDKVYGSYAQGTSQQQQAADKDVQME